MDLRTYLNTQPRGAAAALAEKIGVHRVLVSQWTADENPRGVPIEHCPAIERATNGAVTRRDLRPDDWQRIWPELSAVTPPARTKRTRRAEAA